jgi:chaperonin cofactor prefoldin
MIAAEKEELTKELTSKKEIVDIRVRSIDKQEQKLKEKAETLRAEIMKDLKK